MTTVSTFPPDSTPNKQLNTTSTLKKKKAYTTHSIQEGTHRDLGPLPPATSEPLSPIPASMALL